MMNVYRNLLEFYERLLQVAYGCKFSICNKRCNVYNNCEARIKSELEITGGY